MPKTPVIGFFKSVKLIIVSSSFWIYFRIFILDKYSFHSPLTINKATITDAQRIIFSVGPFLVSFFAAWTYNFVQFISDIDHSVASVNDNKLLVGLATFVHAITKPAKSVRYFSEPRCLFLPVNFLNIFDCIKWEVNTKGWNLRHK